MISVDVPPRSVQQSGATQDDTVLVVDLDGTLCRTDTLHEALIGLLLNRPSGLIGVFRALGHGKASFKDHVATHHIVDPAALPYDPAVIALIEQARAAGRRVELVSASDHRQCTAIAAHLELFDVVIGTGHDGTTGNGNLRGATKARLLVERHGEKGFDYVGDSVPDLQVWRYARRAYVAGRGHDLVGRLRAAGIEAATVGQPVSRLRALFRAMRPHQWAKNVLVFVPALAAHDPGAILPAILAFLAFSLVASGVYLVNDLVDLPSDRAHPRKRNRPLAAGLLGAREAMTTTLTLFVTGIVVASMLPPAFLLALAGYLIATFAYSFWLKRKMVVDIVGLAGLYTLRILGGAAASSIVVSPWLLALSMFLFTSLATLKRQAELEDVLRSGRSEVRGRNLAAEDLGVLKGVSITTGQISVLILALYVQAPDVSLHYANPQWLFLLCPIQFVWLTRMQILTSRGFMDDDPLVFTLRDRVSRICALAGLVIILIATREFPI